MSYMRMKPTRSGFNLSWNGGSQGYIKKDNTYFLRMWTALGERRASFTTLYNAIRSAQTEHMDSERIKFHRKRREWESILARL